MSSDLETGLTNELVLIRQMIEKGGSKESLKDVMDFLERLKKNQAENLFADAITKFQSLMPAVEKKNPVYGKNRDLGPQYFFAKYEEIMDIAQPYLKECGIVVSFDTVMESGLMKTTAHVRVGTHVEHVSVALALPSIPNANDSQRAGGALSYGKRYALIAALNIRVMGEDTDAVGLNPGLTGPHVKELNDLFTLCQEANDPVDAQRFWKYIGCESMKDCPDSKFELAKFELNRKLREARKKAVK